MTKVYHLKLKVTTWCSAGTCVCYGSTVLLLSLACLSQHRQSDALPRTSEQDSFDDIPTCRPHFHTHMCILTLCLPGKCYLPISHPSCKW